MLNFGYEFLHIKATGQVDVGLDGEMNQSAEVLLLV